MTPAQRRVRGLRRRHARDRGPGRRAAGSSAGATADYVAIAILVGFGAYTLFGKQREDEAGASRLATAHGPALILIGLSVSLDELAIGFTLGLLGAPVLPILLAIGVQTFAVS